MDLEDIAQAIRELTARISDLEAFHHYRGDDAGWEESKHPRGQPENKGEFARVPGGAAKSEEPPEAEEGQKPVQKPVQKAAEPPEEPPEPEEPEEPKAAQKPPKPAQAAKRKQATPRIESFMSPNVG